VRAGCIFVSGDDSDDNSAGHCFTAASCGGMMVNAFTNGIARSDVAFFAPSAQIKDILIIGAISGTALSSFNNWRSGGFPTATYDVVTGAAISTVDFSQYRVLYIPSSTSHTPGGVACSDVALLNARAGDIANYVNTLGGSIISLTLGCVRSSFTGSELTCPLDACFTQLTYASLHLPRLYPLQRLRVWLCLASSAAATRRYFGARRDIYRCVAVTAGAVCVVSGRHS
jgi:hypothetical protein